MRALLIKTTTFALLVTLTTGAASAQSLGGDHRFTGQTPTITYVPPEHGTRPTPDYHHASTAAEGFFNGIANGIHSVATLSLSLAQSRILNEQAYAMNRQNRVINTQTFLARQQMKQEARKDRLEQKWIWQDQMKQRKAKREQELALTTYRLPRSQFNADTGEIFWPEVFSRPELAGLCDELNGLFEGLAAEGPQHDYLYRDTITSACEELLAKLRGQRAAFGDDLSGYWEAVNLVSRLDYQARHWSASQHGLGYERGYRTPLASLSF